MTLRILAALAGACGGGVDGPGPVVVNHMVFVGSGYARTGGMGGNVLLAFSGGE